MVEVLCFTMVCFGQFLRLCKVKGRSNALFIEEAAKRVTWFRFGPAPISNSYPLYGH